MPIQLPPLRERTEDIPTLVKHFIEKFNVLHSRKTTGTEILGIREEALKGLCGHSWPGNIRELENVIERAFVLENSKQITLQSLPDEISSEDKPSSPQIQKPDFHDQKEQFERDFIVEALKRFNGRINQTSTHAGIPKNTLLRKIRKYSINPGDYGPVDQFGEEQV
jgi:DNA-binding NtrC family response regulator